MRLAVACAALLWTLPSTAQAQTPPDLHWPTANRPPRPRRANFVEADYTAPAEGRTRVELSSDGRPQWVLVERRLELAPVDRNGDTHDVIGSATCQTPCVMYIPPGPVQLRVRGAGVRDASFDMEVPHERTAVVLRAPSRALYDLGTGLVAVGATVFVAEALVAAVVQGIGPSAPATRGDLGHDGPTLTPAVAISLAAVAGALLAVGIPLLVTQRTGILTRTPMAPMARWTPSINPSGLSVAF